MSAVRSFSRNISYGKGTREEQLARLKKEIETADAIVIGAGAGLSTSAGFTYSGERFEKYFRDFEEKYGYHNMYSLGFYPYDSMEEFWGYWCRYTLFLEAGVGGNTPTIVKYNFWKMTYEWTRATYACLNLGEAVASKEIEKKSICIDGDIGAVLKELKEV